MHTQSNSRFKLGFQTLSWAAIASLTLSGAALGCHRQNPDEVQQLRAQIKALQAENENLKAQQATAQAAPAAQPSAATAPAQPPSGAAAAQAQPTAPKFEDALKTFKAEKRDNEWARLREAPLLNVAKEHIKGSGASLNSVQCKSSACLIIIDVPPNKNYQVMANPWAETALATNQREIWDKRTRYSYLLIRHSKDNPQQGEARVDPLKLNNERMAAKASSEPSAVKTTTQALKPASAKPAAPAQTAAKPQQPAAAPAKPAAAPAKPAAAPAKPAAQAPAAQKPAAQKPAAQATQKPAAAPAKPAQPTPQQSPVAPVPAQPQK